MNTELLKCVSRIKTVKDNHRELENLAMKFVMNEISKNDMYSLAKNNDCKKIVEHMIMKMA